MTESPQEKQEAARIRRRWLTLGEILAIAAVAISGLTFWNSYRQRTHAEAEQARAEGRSARDAAVLMLRATADRDGQVLTIAPSGDSQTIQSQTIRFPTSLGLAPIETTGDARIERDWFKTALVRARKAAEASDETVGDARLPILIATRYIAAGRAHEARAVYELGYVTRTGFLEGTNVRLRGLSLAGAAKDDAGGQARIDALWKGRLPRR